MNPNIGYRILNAKQISDDYTHNVHRMQQRKRNESFLSHTTCNSASKNFDIHELATENLSQTA